MTDISTHDTLARAYDRAASGWQASIARLGYPAAYAELFAARPPRQVARAIDIGTGSGAFALSWVRAGGRASRLELLDPSGPMLKEAGRRLDRIGCPAETILGGMFDNRVIEAGYDVVLVAHVIEHLPDTDAALRWILTRLRPGGRLYLSASRPHWCTAILRWKWGHRAFRPEDFVARLSRAGFAEIRHVPYSAGPPSRTSAGYAAVRPVVRSA